MLIRLAVTALLCLFPLAAGGAAPSRIVILRHGEKADAWMLCGVGQERADALAAFYLGRHAAKSLFAQGEEPAAFLAITLHTLELVAPAAATRGKPLALYSVVPDGTLPKDKDAVEMALNRRTARGRPRPHDQSAMARQDGGDGCGSTSISPMPSLRLPSPEKR